MEEQAQQLDIAQSVNETEGVQIEQAIAPADLYHNAVNAGTEEINPEDLNTPYLKIIQSNTQNIDNKHEGWFYRSDTQQQLETVEVNLVYVTSMEVDNYNKTAKEKVKIYFGFYKDTYEPFRMFIRSKSWSGQAHRDFQTLIQGYKNQLKIPMFALTVKLSTEKQSGVIQESGKTYNTYKIKFEIEKDGEKPLIEINTNRIGFLYDAIKKFQEVAVTSDPTFEEELNSH